MASQKPVALSIDFETCSLADLRRTGVYTYSEDASTQVLMMAWAFGDDPVRVWKIGEPFPAAVRDHVQNRRPVRAWNAGFEFAIWNNTLMRQVPCDELGRPVADLSLSQLSDTMAAAAYWGLPLSLDQAAPAAGIGVQKDKEGHALMMRMCRPRSIDPLTGAVTWWHETDPEKVERLAEYCANDVVVERAVGASIPALPDDEQNTWVLDQIINRRGVGVDYVLVEKLRDLARAAADNANEELRRLTNGQVQSINAHAAFLQWLQFHGYPHDNLRRSTVEARLEDDNLSDIERAGLELRADVARTSAAKLSAMLDASVARGATGTVRGMLQYYGASRTGRWAGRLIQLQNMPRGVIENIDAAISAVRGGATLEVVEALFGAAMGVVSSCLRGCIVARPGRVLVVVDFSQIEARVLPWLAGQETVLAVFRSGGDIYVQAAAGIFGRHFTADHKFSKNDVPGDERQIGKVAVLALGFGGGKGAFQSMAAVYGVAVGDERAEQIKNEWRGANPETVKFWWECDRAARTVINSPSQVVNVGHVRFGMMGRNMLIRLPSGRNLVYRDAKLVPNPDRSGQLDISYYGVNQYTRKFERLRTYGGKLVENIVQATARDVMRDALLASSDKGRDVILTVHDELLIEADDADGEAVLAETLSIMRTAPAWAEALPVDADGWTGKRYKK